MKILDITKKLSQDILERHYEDLETQFNTTGEYKGISLTALPITKDNIEYYQHALKRFKFTHLKMSSCKIDDAVLPLVLSMANDLGIKHLDLSTNNLTKEGYSFLFQNLGKIRKLSLRSNKLNDELFDSFARLIETSGLQHLDLRNNSLSDRSFLTLSEILKKSEQLISLWLKGNIPTRKGFDEFVEQVKYTPLYLTDIDKMFKTDTTPASDLIESHLKTLIKLGKIASKKSSF